MNIPPPLLNSAVTLLRSKLQPVNDGDEDFSQTPPPLHATALSENVHPAKLGVALESQAINQAALDLRIYNAKSRIAASDRKLWAS